MVKSKKNINKIKIKIKNKRKTKKTKSTGLKLLYKGGINNTDNTNNTVNNLTEQTTNQMKDNNDITTPEETEPLMQKYDSLLNKINKNQKIEFNLYNNTIVKTDDSKIDQQQDVSKMTTDEDDDKISVQQSQQEDKQEQITTKTSDEDDDKIIEQQPQEQPQQEETKITTDEMIKNMMSKIDNNTQNIIQIKETTDQIKQPQTNTAETGSEKLLELINQ